MEFMAALAELSILTAVVLLWARWSKLDLALRSPALDGVWPWIAFFIAWCAIEWAIIDAYPIDVAPEWVERMQQLTLLQALVLDVAVGPVFEELLFRGALFAALLRRWGVAVAAVVPSVLWGAIHLQYEAWYLASIAGSGVVLAIIRWKSGSLYAPLALHSGFNFVATLDWYLGAPPVG
jgi:hypothetical protein